MKFVTITVIKLRFQVNCTEEHITSHLGVQQRCTTCVQQIMRRTITLSYPGVRSYTNVQHSPSAPW